ncbi:putative oligopeptide transporter 4-like [Capsicum annuum]|nr:putative oligopeptide transporter 4-like [Capsicum annuum]KAF3647079.1 putative oligopeptide transporter 4-like [Capsicum annuum]
MVSTRSREVRDAEPLPEDRLLTRGRGRGRGHPKKIPPGFRDYKNGKLPKRVSLRDRLGHIWSMRVAKIGREIYFQYGWPKFVKDNKLKHGDFLIFDYDGNKIFNIKILGSNGYEKKEDGCLKLGVLEESEEMNIEHQKCVEPKGKNWARYSNSSSYSNRSDKDSLKDGDKEYDQTKKMRCSKWKDVQEEEVYEEEDEFEEEEEEDKEETKKVTHSKRKHVEEEGYLDYDDDQEEEGEETEEEEVNERSGTFNNKESRLKASWKRSTDHKVNDLHDTFGANVFKSGCAIQPKNPYFVAKVQSKRRNQLYVPMDVVRDYKHEFPSTMSIRDSAGREFETRVVKWKDGRIWVCDTKDSLRVKIHGKKDSLCDKLHAMKIMPPYRSNEKNTLARGSTTNGTTLNKSFLLM